MNTSYIKRNAYIAAHFIALASNIHVGELQAHHPPHEEDVTIDLTHTTLLQQDDHPVINEHRAQPTGMQRLATKSCFAFGALNFLVTSMHVQELQRESYPYDARTDALLLACASLATATTGLIYGTGFFRRPPHTLNRKIVIAGSLGLAYGHAIMSASYAYPEYAAPFLTSGIAVMAATGSALMVKGYQLCRSTR